MSQVITIAPTENTQALRPRRRPMSALRPAPASGTAISSSTISWSCWVPGSSVGCTAVTATASRCVAKGTRYSRMLEYSSTSGVRRLR